jgi:hypothetical protein
VDELARFRESFGDFALSDVKRASAGHAKIGAFILAAHLIDALACLSTTQSNDKAAWDEFVPAFLPAYSSASEELYRSYRGLLSHRYSLKGFRLVDGEDYRDRHWTIEEGERVLHLESFIEDLEDAWSEFSAKLGRDVQFRERVVGRARENPPLSVLESPTGTASAAFSLTSLSPRGHLAGATHFGSYLFTKSVTEPLRNEDEHEEN